MYSDHIVNIYWGIETQNLMVIITSTGVKHVIYVNICKVKVTKDDKIEDLSRAFHLHI
jgi:hypothetical protein